MVDTADLPVWAKVALAVSFRRLAVLRIRLPLAVNLIVIVTLPAAAIRALPVATSTALALVVLLPWGT